MSEIPYTPLTGKIRKYFEKIQEVAIPNKVKEETEANAFARNVLRKARVT